MPINPITNMASIMFTIQPSSPIDIAARNHARLFTVYVVVLVLGGLLAALFTVLVYRAGNAYQDAIKADADARIAEANQKAAEANERAAEAQKELAKIQARFVRRTLTQTERNNIVGMLHAYLTIAKEAKEKRGEVLMIVHPTGDNEATEFANLLGHLFIQAGWSTTVRELPYAEHQIGISLVVHDSKDLPLYAQVLTKVFEELEFPATVREEKSVDNKWTYLEIGSKD
jgi:phosphate/sulfate permease